MAKSATKTEKGKSRFEFACLKSRKPILNLGAKGEDVYQLQTVLRSMGYLGRDCDPGTLCNMTSAAIKHFQKCYHLNDSGEGDEKTLRLLSSPRCGNPDVEAGAHSSGAAPFVLRGCKYNTTNLTYAFVNSTSDLSVDRQRAIFREAFAAWSNVCALNFTEIAPTENPNFPIAFHHGDHGDGSSFDTGGDINGNVLAHAFYPPTCGGVHAGAMHFDEHEYWTDAAAPGGIRLLNVAIHEIGHLLGLAHSNVRDAIMYAFYDNNIDSLRADDITGIQELYGPRLAGTVPIRGNLARTGANQVHRINGQSGRIQVTLRGPRDADFDLYLRSGTAPTRNQFDARAFTSSSEEAVSLQLSGGDVFIMVDSWRGSGAYEVHVQFS